MKTLLALTTAAVMLTASTAFAAPLEQPGAYGPVPAAAAVRPSPAQTARARVSYGVGYHGRSSATGGPVGGYPSRN